VFCPSISPSHRPFPRYQRLWTPWVTLNFNFVFSTTYRNRNRRLKISTAPTKARSRGPAYSQALIQDKIDRQQVRSRASGRQTVRRVWWMDQDGVWSWDGEEGWEKRMNRLKSRVCSLGWKSCGERARGAVWGERAVGREQGVQFWWVRRMGQIVVAMLAGVCSKEAGQLWLRSDNKF